MTYDPDVHRRRSIRLQGYDYSCSGAYFVTMCTENRECLFGEIVADEMRLNDAGQMVQMVWEQLPDHYPGVDVDGFVVMPNHIHGIIVLAGDPVGATLCGPPGQARGQGQARGPAPTRMSLPDVVQRFKSFTTTLCRRGVKERGWPPFPGRFWQRNYYEHIVRNDDELNCIRAYIQMNPARWAWDRQNADAIPGWKPDAPWQV